MKFKIILSTLLISTLLFGISTTTPIQKKQNKVLNKIEVISLFTDMYVQVLKHYYGSDAFDIDHVVAEFEKKVEAHEPLTKYDLYKMINEELSGKSGFYTEDAFKTKFAKFMDNPSDVKIEYIGDILHLKVHNLKEENLETIATALKKKPKKIIVDFRDNDDGNPRAMMKFANMLVSDAVILSKRYINAKGKNIFWKFSGDANSTLVGDVKIAILVNHKTAGVAEAVAHSLRYSKNVKVIGQETAGESNIFSLGRLKNGDVYILKNGEYFYNKFYIIDRIGSQPNFVVFEDNPKLDKTLIKAMHYLGGKK